MYWLFIIISAIIFFVGLSLLIGAGWALVVFHLITQTAPSSDLTDAQKSFKEAKKGIYKILGVLMIILSLILFVYSSGKI